MDVELIEAQRERYQRAASAMQKGVAMALRYASHKGAEPKQLRVGVNSAMVENHTILKLLMQKGIIGELEYITALADEMEAEVQRYEKILEQNHGVEVDLI